MYRSGHTAQTCIGFLFIWRTLSTLGCCRAVGIGLLLYIVMYMWSVLVLRMHYSIDVVVAAIVGVFVYTHAGFLNFCWIVANRVACNMRSPETPEVEWPSAACTSMAVIP